MPYPELLVPPGKMTPAGAPGSMMEEVWAQTGFMVKSIHEKTNNANIKAILFLITAPADLIAGAPFRRNVSDEIADGPLLTVLRDDLNFDIDRQPNGVCIH